jgi:hypothetical protein
MDDETIREHAQALCDALVGGDIDRATTDFSPELRKHMGEVLGLLPLPSTEATVQSVERGGSSYVVLLHLVGESEEVVVQTRWKDRDGRPTMIEASHQSRQEVAPPVGEAEADSQAEGQAQDLGG